jgi:hypothetical protein
MKTSKRPLIIIWAVAISLALTSVTTAGAVVASATGVERAHGVVVRDGPGDVYRYHYRHDWYELAGRVPGADVLGLQARHTASEVRVTLAFQNLRRRWPANYVFYFQTESLGRYVFVDVDEKHWAGRHFVGNEEGDQLGARGVRHWISYRNDTLTVWMPRALLHDPAVVRVGAMNYLGAFDQDWYEDNPLTHDPVRGYPPSLSVPIYAP